MFGTTQRDLMVDLLDQLERRTGRIFNEPFRYIRLACTRGRDGRLAAAGGHL